MEKKIFSGTIQSFSFGWEVCILKEILEEGKKILLKNQRGMSFNTNIKY